MDDFKTLRDYQLYLRDRMEAARGDAQTENIVFLGFVAGGKNYMIDGRDISDIHQPSTLQPIPGSKPWVAGAANISGEVCAVTDFSVLLGGERIRKGKFMVLSSQLIPGAAILIDGISGIFEEKDIGQISLNTESGLPDWLVGSHVIDTTFTLVDAAKLANDPRFSKLQSGDSQ